MPSSPKFHQKLKAMGDLHDKKQADYGKSNDPFANLRGTSEWSCPNCHDPIPAWLGVLIRMNDKMARLKSYTANGSLKNEGVMDSLQDLGVYATIAQVLWEEEVDAKRHKSS